MLAYGDRQHSSAIVSKSNKIIATDGFLMPDWTGIDAIRLSSALADWPFASGSTGCFILCLINTFRRNENGAIATEYAMLIVFVAFAIAAGAQTLRGGITDLFNKVSTSLTSVTMPTL